MVSEIVGSTEIESDASADSVLVGISEKVGVCVRHSETLVAPTKGLVEYLGHGRQVLAPSSD